ncbi:hypothetical protein C8J57DRAFT_193831 [Mycena rebaudengoi]|nr:hypothetical protein C8J57DRAFT_193831 [Mycena rebaudengoi]
MDPFTWGTSSSSDGITSGPIINSSIRTVLKASPTMDPFTWGASSSGGGIASSPTINPSRDSSARTVVKASPTIGPYKRGTSSSSGGIASNPTINHLRTGSTYEWPASGPTQFDAADAPVHKGAAKARKRDAAEMEADAGTSINTEPPPPPLQIRKRTKVDPRGQLPRDSPLGIPRCYSEICVLDDPEFLDNLLWRMSMMLPLKNARLVPLEVPNARICRP